MNLIFECSGGCGKTFNLSSHITDSSKFSIDGYLSNKLMVRSVCICGHINILTMSVIKTMISHKIKDGLNFSHFCNHCLHLYEYMPESILKAFICESEPNFASKLILKINIVCSTSNFHEISAYLSINNISNIPREQKNEWLQTIESYT